MDKPIFQPSLPSYTLNASNGCDSVVYLDLTVNNIDLSVTDNSPTLSANQVNAISMA